VDPTTPTILYAGTSHTGVFKSIDGGATWTATNAGLGSSSIESLVVDPTHPATVYVATQYGGVFKTTDGGTSWSGAGLSSVSVAVLALDATASDTLYAGTQLGVFKTTDAGGSWTAANTGMGESPVASLALNPIDPAIVYAGTMGNGVFKTTDGGASWTAVNSGLGNSFVSTLALDPGSPAILYAGTWGGVFKSTNAGASWSAVNAGLPAASFVALAIDPATPGTVYAGSCCSGVFKSTDGGASWTPANTGLMASEIFALALDPAAPDTLYAGTRDNGVFKSTNAGASWTAVNAGLMASVIPALALDTTAPGALYAGSLAGGVFKTTTAGADWTRANSGLERSDVHTLVMDPSTPSTLYAGTWGGGVWKSADGAMSWTSAGLSDATVSAFAVASTSPTTLYAGAVDTIFKSIDAGNTWAPANTGLTTSEVLALAADPGAPSTVYAGTREGVFKTTNAGATWVGIGLASSDVWALAIDSTVPATIYAGTCWDGVFKSTDAGASWTAMSTGLPYGCVFALALDPAIPGTVYAGTNGAGIFKSTNGGDTWTAANDGLTNRVVNTIAIDPGDPDVLYAGTNGGVFVLRENAPPSVPTSRGQRQHDGTTPIPLGGTAFSGTVVFRGTVSDPDAGQTVRFQVEVQPVGTSFAGTLSCESDFVVSGTTATCTVNDLVGGTAYHWRLRSVDVLGGTSAWASYATNAETAPDFVVNREPLPPATLEQRQADGVSLLPLGGTTTSSRVVFLGTVSDADAGQQVRLEVEAKLVAASFTGEVSCRGALVPSGTATNCSMDLGLNGGRGFRWRARTVDSIGSASAWVGYGGNPESEPDFVLNNTPSPPSALSQRQADGWVSIPLGGVAGSTVVFRADVSAPNLITMLYLQVEAKPVGSDFTGTASCQSALVPNLAASVPCTVTGLVAGTGYHWQARTVDQVGTASAWVSYGANAESVPDFRVSAAPSPPGALDQRLSDGITSIPVGGIIAGSTVVFFGIVHDPDAGQRARLEVEVGQSQTTTKIQCQSPLVSSGTHASCSVKNLSGSHYWRARTLDSTGTASAWASFGGNSAFAPDFSVNAAPWTPIGLGQRQADGTTGIPLGGLAGSTVVFSGLPTDANGTQQVRLRVEIKPVGTAFIRTMSCQGPLVLSGTVTSCRVNGLTPGTRYHWQAWTVDELGKVSPPVAYGWNSESDPDFVVSRPPSLPAARGQRQADGATPLPLGGTASSGTVVFRATVSDSDPGQAVRLQVEVQPLGTSFAGTVSCQSSLVASGTATACGVSALVAGTAYHWRARTVDDLGSASAWASYATNAEGAADFVVNAKPAVPTSRFQRQADGTTNIGLGGWASTSTVVFAATVADADAGQAVGLQVEAKPVGTAFDGTLSCQSALVPSGTATSCTVPTLAAGTAYHWRLRTADNKGGFSTWVSYATNAEDAADFVVNTRPAAPMSRFQRQANGTTPIPLGGAATSPTVVLGGTVSDADAGQSVRVQVEVKPLDTPFDGTVSCQTALVPSGTDTSCAVNSLAPGTVYHWRLRAVDSKGTPSAWVSYATNAETAADFVVVPEGS
jgi:photosystem II stability/assembly factor-like uncharacterized protein